MAALYATYKQNGILKRGVLSQQLYEKYSKDSSISELQLFPNQSFMENAFNEAKGIPSAFKQILHD